MMSADIPPIPDITAFNNFGDLIHATQLEHEAADKVLEHEAAEIDADSYRRAEAD